MSLDPTAREANVRDSVKKFFVDNIYTTEGIEVLFDTSVSSPNLSNHSTDRWVTVRFGTMEFSSLSRILVYVYLATRKDTEGFRLAQLRDTVMGYLTDATTTMRAIPFYRSRSTGAWTLLGGLAVQEIMESEEMAGPDRTKIKMLTVILRTASKV